MKKTKCNKCGFKNDRNVYKCGKCGEIFRISKQKFNEFIKSTKKDNENEMIEIIPENYNTSKRIILIPFFLVTLNGILKTVSSLIIGNYENILDSILPTLLFGVVTIIGLLIRHLILIGFKKNNTPSWYLTTLSIIIFILSCIISIYLMSGIGGIIFNYINR